MRTSLSKFTLRLLTISVLICSEARVSGQVNKLALGVGAGYSFTPIKFSDDGSSFEVYDLMGNFTPTLTVRYGNKISGVFKASYIQNSFKESDFGQYFPTNMRVYKAKFHQIHTDFLFEHSPFGSRGFFYYLGPGIGIPVKVSMSEEYWREAYYIYPAEHTYEEYTVPAEFKLYLQGVFGLGGYIPVKEKNLISIECNVRVGLQKVTINLEHSWEARMVAIQLNLGYLRRF